MELQLAGGCGSATWHGCNACVKVSFILQLFAKSFHHTSTAKWVPCQCRWSCLFELPQACAPHLATSKQLQASIWLCDSGAVTSALVRLLTAPNPSLEKCAALLAPVPLQ